MANLIVGGTLPPLLVPPAGLIRWIAVILFSAAFLSATGAFDTDKAATIPRIGYWVLMSVTGSLLLQGFHSLLSRRVAQPQWRLRTWGWAILSVPLTAAALVLCKTLFGGPLTIGRFGALLPGMMSISAALQLLLWLFPPNRTAEPRTKPPEPPKAALLSLTQSLPLPLRRAKICAVKAEDHYVRIYTSDGDALVRMRFRDATDALLASNGVRPHRSWWVAEDEICGMERLGRRAFITLKGGCRVPVSRRAAGMLGPSFPRRAAPLSK